MKFISTLFIAIVAVVSVVCAYTRNSAIAEEAWDLHLTKKKTEHTRKKEESHEDP